MPEAEPERSKLLDAATMGAYRFGSLASRLMPSAVAQAAASSLGFTASFANQARREMIARHLRRVNPRLQGTALRLAVQQAFDSYARYYMESFRLPSLSARTVDRTFSVDGFDLIPAALEQGKGCIFALPHLGGWEWAGRWMTDQGYKLTVVVEALQPPELFEWFAELRQELGMTVVPTGPKAGAAVLAARTTGSDTVVIDGGRICRVAGTWRLLAVTADGYVLGRVDPGRLDVSTATATRCA